jgi:anti-sigma factor RsiW
MKPRRTGPGGHDINCAQAVSLVTDYLDGTLTQAERARFEAHLVDCDNCTEHVKQIQVTVAAAGSGPRGRPRPGVRQDLMKPVPPVRGRSARLTGRVTRAPSYPWVTGRRSATRGRPSSGRDLARAIDDRYPRRLAAATSPSRRLRLAP